MFNKHTLSALPLILLLACQSAFAAEPTEAELLAQCDLNKNGKVDYHARDPSQVSQAERNEILKEAACAHQLKMAALAKEIPGLIAQCDTNGNGEIDDSSRHGVISRSEFKALKPELRDLVGREKACVTQASIAQKDASIAKSNDDYRKLIQILAMLSPTEARTFIADDIQRIEKVISEAKAANQPYVVKPLENLLNILRTEQKKLK